MSNFFQNDLIHWIALATVLLGIYAQGSYIYAIYKAKKSEDKVDEEVKPAFLSWIGWSLLMGISFISQYISEGWSLKQITLLLATFGCFAVGISARFIFKRYSYEKKHNKFVLYGLGCSVIYWVTNDPWITTIIAIVADGILAIPVIQNAIKNPEQEKSKAWPIFLFTWILNIIMVRIDFSWLDMLWPMYLILFNSTMILLTLRKNKLKKINS
jgi:hypothetical protein